MRAAALCLMLAGVAALLTGCASHPAPRAAVPGSCPNSSAIPRPPRPSATWPRATWRWPRWHGSARRRATAASCSTPQRDERFSRARQDRLPMLRAARGGSLDTAGHRRGAGDQRLGRIATAPCRGSPRAAPIPPPAAVSARRTARLYPRISGCIITFSPTGWVAIPLAFAGKFGSLGAIPGKILGINHIAGLRARPGIDPAGGGRPLCARRGKTPGDSPVRWLFQSWKRTPYQICWSANTPTQSIFGGGNGLATTTQIIEQGEVIFGVVPVQ